MVKETTRTLKVMKTTMAPNSGFAATTSWLFPTALRLPSGDRHDPVDARALPPSSSAAAAAAIWGRLATRLQVGTLSDPDRHSSVLVPDMSEEYDFPASSAIRITPTPMPDLATLYDMPQSLHPYYRPLNIFATLGLWLVSACTSLLSMISMDRWRAIASGIVVPFAKNILGACSSIIKESLQIKGWRMMLRFFIQTAALALVSQMVLQDLLGLGPSRISIANLKRQYFLPSRLSRFERIPFSLSDTAPPSASSALGVHHLKYVPPLSQQQSSTKRRFKVLYFNHGFGANSLSWLPAIPALTDRLGARVGLAHDAVGFGFTELAIRSNQPSYPAANGENNANQSMHDGQEDHNGNDESDLYQFTSSAKIGLELIRRASSSSTSTSTSSRAVNANGSSAHSDTDTNDEPVALFGHSMGSIATLHMALNLPKSTPKTVVLVAPALGLQPTSTTAAATTARGDATPNRAKSAFQRLRSKLRGSVFDPTASYVLRRVVGKQGFWRRGLTFCWADPKNKLSQSSVIAFMWPSILQGWEGGILNFARAASNRQGYSDEELVQRVLALPNTSVHVIYSADDPVIRPSIVERTFAKYKHLDNLNLVKLEGVGHDPFEEDTDGFVRTVEDMLSASADDGTQNN